MALNPFGIYCKFAINSESEAVLSFSVKCQSNKTDITLSPHLKNWVQKRGGILKTTSQNLNLVDGHIDKNFKQAGSNTVSPYLQD